MKSLVCIGIGIITLAMRPYMAPDPIPFTLPVEQSCCDHQDYPQMPDYDTTRWTELTAKDGFVIDVRYATTNNFTGAVIYPCGRMFMRPEPARVLKKVLKALKAKGYRLKLFDGYRPSPAQQKLWDKVPNPDYVAPPAKGSMHNRGVAIDLTLTNMNGDELDMGTAYDFFGPEAHQDYTALPAEIMARRSILKSTMESHGFKSIRTEWWHYSYTTKSYPLDHWEWPCPGAKH